LLRVRLGKRSVIAGTAEGQARRRNRDRLALFGLRCCHLWRAQDVGDKRLNVSEQCSALK